MLGYECIEDNIITDKIKNQRDFDKELCLAEKFVSNNHSPLYSVSELKCPLTGNKNIKPIFEKWGQKYYICEESWTIFSEVPSSIVNKFHFQSELTEFRLSDSYQQDSTKRRDVLWNKILDWVAFRSYRYLKQNKNLYTVDYGNRYIGFVEKIKNSEITGKYILKNSILQPDDKQEQEADICLFLDVMQQSYNPYEYFKKIYSNLKPGGLVFISTRVATGFDVLLLKDFFKSIYPYEHILLPSKYSLSSFLEEIGFEILEITTPGLMDVNYVQDNINIDSEENLFIKCLIKTLTKSAKIDLQHFLQKHGYSSYMQMIARKKQHE